jgi:hydrogenase maturation protease
VRIVDYGIRGMHLAYDLLEGYDALVLVDAVAVGDKAGEVTVLEVGPDDIATLGSGDLDAHGMSPVAVLASLERLGGTLPRTYVVGCRPVSTEEGIGLSDTVADAVPVAAEVVARLTETLLVGGRV